MSKQHFQHAVIKDTKAEKEVEVHINRLHIVMLQKVVIFRQTKRFRKVS